MEPYKEETIEGYKVLALPVCHSVPTVGYEVTSADDKSFFYSSDTGPGLSSCWDYISPQLLIINLTLPNRFEDIAIEAGHLTPKLMGAELARFRELKGYLPPVVTIHMNPQLENEIREEVAKLAEELGAQITLGYEGMRMTV